MRRTLSPLLFRPGFLSAEFNAGGRMRYMPPFRLYIDDTRINRGSGCSISRPGCLEKKVGSETSRWR
ncbi:DUF3667 domain-containing protein [Congregibacter sp.]|uniref:DUF3667 domain-containing protein n=1 Tax=Congregibacter sp. TaxID=2744308 RepID=UPI0039E44222